MKNLIRSIELIGRVGSGGVYITLEVDPARVNAFKEPETIKRMRAKTQIYYIQPEQRPDVPKIVEFDPTKNVKVEWVTAWVHFPKVFEFIMELMPEIAAAADAVARNPQLLAGRPDGTITGTTRPTEEKQ